MSRTTKKVLPGIDWDEKSEQQCIRGKITSEIHFPDVPNELAYGPRMKRHAKKLKRRIQRRQDKQIIQNEGTNYDING